MGGDVVSVKANVGYKPSARQDQHRAAQSIDNRHSPTSASEKKKNVDPGGIANSFYC